MKKYLIVANKQKSESEKISHSIKEFFEQKCSACDIKIAFVDKDNFAVNQSDINNSDCVIVLGGDGTLLRVAKQTITSKTPVIGVNLGHLGYLAEVEKENLEDSMEALLNNRYQIENRMLLHGSIIRNNEVISSSVAMNDIVITRGGSLQALSLIIYVNKQLLKNYSADGVIISTPGGSTAYNLSAGGPIVEPGADIMLMTPISPHSFMNRSIVLKASDCLETKIGEHDIIGDQCVEVNFDGSCRTQLLPGDIVQITRAEQTVSIVKINKTGFLEVLHRKMSEV